MPDAVDWPVLYSQGATRPLFDLVLRFRPRTDLGRSHILGSAAYSGGRAIGQLANNVSAQLSMNALSGNSD
jgi:hypothetical protein